MLTVTSMWVKDKQVYLNTADRMGVISEVRFLAKPSALSLSLNEKKKKPSTPTFCHFFKVGGGAL